MKRIALTGGGTGGHIYPLLAVAAALQKSATQQSEALELHYIGFIGDYGSALAERGIVVHPIMGGKLRRYFSLQNILDIPKFFIGLIQAWFKLYFLMPDVIFSKGGTGALPVLIAGWFYRIPIMLHESDTVPGLNNLIGSRFAKRIAVSFESTLRYFNPRNGIFTGSPLRPELLTNQESGANAKQALGFEATQPLVLVLGGSQGAQRLNELILITLPQLMKMTQVLHQTGRPNFLDIEKLSKAALLEVPVAPGQVPLRYQPVAYFENNMATALAAADLIVSRSGSNIFEFAAFGKPAILIPLAESANDHQRSNAYAFAEHGAGIVIEEPNLLPDIFLAQVRKVLGDEPLRTRMEAASRAFFLPEAAEKIAQEIWSLAS